MQSPVFIFTANCSFASDVVVMAPWCRQRILFILISVWLLSWLTTNCRLLFYFCSVSGRVSSGWHYWLFIHRVRHDDKPACVDTSMFNSLLICVHCAVICALFFSAASLGRVYQWMMLLGMSCLTGALIDRSMPASHQHLSPCQRDHQPYCVCDLIRGMLLQLDCHRDLGFAATAWWLDGYRGLWAILIH